MSDKRMREHWGKETMIEFRREKYNIQSETLGVFGTADQDRVHRLMSEQVIIIGPVQVSILNRRNACMCGCVSVRAGKKSN